MAFVHFKLACRYTVATCCTQAQVHACGLHNLCLDAALLHVIPQCSAKNSHVKATHKCVLIDWGVCGWQDVAMVIRESVGSGARIQYLDVNIAGVAWSGIVVCVWLTRCRDEI